MKGRTARDNAAADAIAKIFTLFCLTYKICIISRHLPGVSNEPADFLSRDLQYMPQDGDEDICRGRMSEGDTREQICRKLLKECVICLARISRLEQSTRDSYSTAWRSWVNYCKIAEIEEDCRHEGHMIARS